MKRVLVFLATTVVTIVATASVALAQGYNPPPTGPQVAPKVIKAPSGLAFTGSELGALIVFAALALVLGVGLYALGRRHARAAA